MSKQQTEYIGSVSDMGQEEEDAAPADRRSMLSKQATEYIGSVSDMGEEEEEDAPDRRAGLAKERTMSRYRRNLSDVVEEEEE